MTESYIVRIYQRNEQDPNAIAGLLEVVETGEVKQFSNSRVLSDLLCKTGGNKLKTRTCRSKNERY